MLVVSFQKGKKGQLHLVQGGFSRLLAMRISGGCGWTALGCLSDIICLFPEEPTLGLATFFLQDQMRSNVGNVCS